MPEPLVQLSPCLPVFLTFRVRIQLRCRFLQGQRTDSSTLPFDVELAQLMPAGLHRTHFLDRAVVIYPMNTILDSTLHLPFEFDRDWYRQHRNIQRSRLYGSVGLQPIRVGTFAGLPSRILDPRKVGKIRNCSDGA